MNESQLALLIASIQAGEPQDLEKARTLALLTIAQSLMGIWNALPAAGRGF